MTDHSLTGDVDRPPFPLRFDAMHCVSRLDLGARVQPLVRWVPLADTSVLIGSSGDPLLPSWASVHGMVVRQVTRRWFDATHHGVSLRLTPAWGNAIFTGRCQIARHGLAEVGERCDYLFRISDIEPDCRAAHRAFIRSAIRHLARALRAPSDRLRPDAHVDDAG